MNGRAAKTARRTDRLRELVAQAHNRLHQDDVDAAHELLHVALGSGETAVTTEPLMDREPFDAAFRALCVAKGARAAYVLVEPSGRMLSGGDAEVCALVDRAMREHLR